jgi:hypothetical protein
LHAGIRPLLAEIRKAMVVASAGNNPATSGSIQSD